MALPGASRGEQELLSRAVADLSRVTGFPVAFGGLAQDGALTVTASIGTRTRMLDGLVVHADRGLGGKSLVEKRPRLALDYRTARGITHDYDRAVLGEGIATLFAVPVIVNGRARGVLYGGAWQAVSVGDVIARPAFTVAESLATELRIRDEVARRMAAISAPEPRSVGSAALEELRESYAELRSIAASVEDDDLRARLARVESRLAAMSGMSVPDEASESIRLSPRETDVLSCAALGSTNSEIALMLSLKEGTVKSYLQSAMAKLDVSTRHAAVTKARRAGILP